MSKLAVLVMVVFGLVTSIASAVTLPEVPTAPSYTLPIDTNEPPTIPCDQIVDRLLKYNQMAREHDTSISGFLGEVNQKVTEWFDLLSPLEGTPQTIASGTFTPLQRGADQIANITNLAFDNSDLLAQEMDKIIASLSACKISTSP